MHLALPTTAPTGPTGQSARLLGDRDRPALRATIASLGRTSGFRRARPAVAMALVAALLPARFGGPVGAAPAVPLQAFTYEVAETWFEVAPPADVSLALDPQDLSSDPSAPGRTYVLARSRSVRDPAGDEAGWALHVHEAGGGYVGLRPLADKLGPAIRIDVGFDRTVHVLGRLRLTAGAPWGVLRLSPDGSIVGEFPLAVAGTPSDIAVAPDGRVYVSMLSVTGGPDEMTIYSAEGTLLDRIVPPERGADNRFSYDLFHLDIDADGVVYVISVAIRPCPPAVNPPNPPRLPTPTPRPSMLGTGGPAPDQAEPTPDFPCSKEVVLVFEPDSRFREEVPNPHTTDIAVGVSGVYVSTSAPWRRPSQKIYRLAAENPAFQFPVPGRLDVPVEWSTSMLELDVTALGHVQAVTNLAEPCYRGAVDFGLPDPAGRIVRSPRALGVYDRPALEGPYNPRRIDARSELLALEVPYQRYGTEGQANTAVDIRHDAAAIQRWRLTGHPYGQWVQHDNVLRDGASGGDTTNSVHPLIDLATDGEHVYGLSTQAIWHRPATDGDGLAADWYRRVSGSYFMAISADAGRAAVLSATVERVLVLDADGWPLYDRPIFADTTRHLLSDLALHGDRVYIADEGRQRILVRTIDGRDLGEWPVADGPRAVSVDGDGDVYVLGRGGGVSRHRPDGTLVAAWRVPVDHNGVPVDAQDLTVGDDMRVYVSFVGLSDPPPDAERPGRGRGYDIDAGGIWVFEPAPIQSEPTPPTAGACVARPDKWADPRIILLGEEVDVTLTVTGACPGYQERQQVFIVLDTSWSMHDNYYPGQRGPGALTRAKTFLNSLLLQLDPSLVDLALVTFSNGAGVEMPLPSAVPDVRSRVLSRIADGDTRMGAGVALAHSQLLGPHGDRSLPQTILIVSDGVFKDDPAAAIAAAQADGIRVRAIVLSTPEFDAQAQARLDAAVGDGDSVLVDPLPEMVGEALERLVAYRPNPGLFRSITVTDVVPGNMTYLDGSAHPDAVHDESAGTLEWSLTDVPSSQPIRLTFRLRPQQTGTWPTNVRATADYVDALGNHGRLLFPQPWVLVLAPDPLATATPTPTLTPPPTVTRPPRTYTIYLPIVHREKRCIPKTVYSDVALVLDMSTSMDRPTEAGRTKRAAALTAAGRFVRLLQLEPDQNGAHHQVAIVGFNDRAWTQTGLTGDRTVVEEALARLEDGVQEGTRIDLALVEGQRALTGPGRRPANRGVLVLLTDGLPNRVPTPAPIGPQEATVLAEADRVKAAGTTVYAIGLGQPGDVLSALLAPLASDPSMFYITPDAEDLAAIYRRILVHIACQ